MQAQGQNPRSPTPPPPDTPHPLSQYTDPRGRTPGFVRVRYLPEGGRVVDVEPPPPPAPPSYSQVLASLHLLMQP